MKKVLILSILITAIASYSFVLKNDGLAGRTGAPGETTCNTIGCHTGNAVNDPSGSVTISAPGLDNSWEYIPGTTYQIHITVSRTGNPKFGFGFESLLPSGANAGTLTITNTAETQIKTTTVSGNVRNNVVHKVDGGLTNDSHTFTFDWTAPAAGTGDVTFYAAGNAANDQDNTAGDYIFTINQNLTEESGNTLNEIAFGSSLNVSPNPVNETIHIKFSNSESLSAGFALFNIHGEQVQLFSAKNFAPGSHQMSLGINENIPNGIYMLRVVSGKEQAVRKVVVVR